MLLLESEIIFKNSKHDHFFFFFVGTIWYKQQSLNKLETFQMIHKGLISTAGSPIGSAYTFSIFPPRMGMIWNSKQKWSFKVWMLKGYCVGVRGHNFGPSNLKWIRIIMILGQELFKFGHSIKKVLLMVIASGHKEN